jgi:PPOX class probable F420-dependent enzyme
MAKQRDRIQMTDSEVRAFLEAGRSLQLATLDRAGAPHLVTMWYGIDDQGRVVLETYSKSQKLLNVRRDPRIALLVEAGTEYAELRGVSIQARAEIVEDKERVREILRLVMLRNHPGISPDMLERGVEAGARKRTGIIAHPLRVISWDHRKLGAAGA